MPDHMITAATVLLYSLAFFSACAGINALVGAFGNREQ